MNCQNCNTRIDYNYVTNCPQCDGEVEKEDLPKLDPSGQSKKKTRVWLVGLANLIYVFVTSAVGMVSGAVVSYFGAAVTYLVLSSPERYPGQHCSRGMAVGMLSIIVGGFLGTAGGSAFAVKHLIPNRNSNNSL